MSDYSIGVTSVPLGGRAVASIETMDNGVDSDVDSVTVEWRDNAGTLVETLTRTTFDVSGTDIYGNPSTLTDPLGIGSYQATLVIDSTHYTPPASGQTWTLIITIVKGSKTASAIFPFTVVPTTLSISIDQTTIAQAVMRQTGILEEVSIVAPDANPILNLRSGPVYAIQAAYKDGVAIANPADYGWQIYRGSVALVTAPTAGQNYTFVVQKRSDAFVMDIVNRSVQDVMRALRPHFDYTMLVQIPGVAELVKALAIGQLKQDLSQGVALESAVYRSGRDLQLEAKAEIIRLQRGEENLFDTNGVAVPRISGAIAGGVRNANGPFVNRLGLQDRLQQYTGLFITLRPDPIIAQTRADRGFTT